MGRKGFVTAFNVYIKTANWAACKQSCYAHGITYTDWFADRCIEWNEFKQDPQWFERYQRRADRMNSCN